MAEKILVSVLVIIYMLLLAGSVWYFLFFAYSLWLEVNGFAAVVVFFATFYGLLSIWVNVKNMLS